MNILKAWIKKHKVMTALGIYLLLAIIVYFLCVYPLISLIYRGEAFFPLNLIKLAKVENSLNFYLRKMDKIFLSFNLLIGFFTLLFYSIVRSYKNNKASFLFIAIFLSFYCLYLFLGNLITPSLPKYNFFGSDYWEWTLLKWEAYHKGSHPLILLLVVPLGFLVNSLITSTQISAVILNSFFGALAVLLSSVFFWNLTKKYLETSLLTILFGLSMSQLVFSAVPESYALASCSVIVTYIVFLISLQKQQLQLGYWLIAGLFSFGVTITNFSQTLICFIAFIFNQKRSKIISKTLGYIIAVLLLAIFISILQKMIFSNAKYFFLPTIVTTQLKYVQINLLSNPLLVIQEVIKNFLLVNFLSPSPFTGLLDSGSSSRLILGFFKVNLEYSWIGYIGLIMWLSLFTIGFSKNLTTSCNRIYITAISGAVMYNITLHSFFGVEEMFLYTCHFTFPVLLLAANKSILEKKYFKLCLLFLILLMAINNLIVFIKIAAS